MWLSKDLARLNSLTLDNNKAISWKSTIIFWIEIKRTASSLPNGRVSKKLFFVVKYFEVDFIQVSELNV